MAAQPNQHDMDSSGAQESDGKQAVALEKTENTENLPDLKELEVSVDAARRANEEEHDLTVRRALKIYWKAVLWSLIVSMSIVMEGYDMSLIFNFFGYPAFRRQFGREYPNGDWQVPGPWQSALGSVNTAGCIAGAFINGWAIKRFGFRPTFFVGLIFMIGFIFISFFGKTVLLQTIGQLLCGQVPNILTASTLRAPGVP